MCVARVESTWVSCALRHACVSYVPNRTTTSRQPASARLPTWPLTQSTCTRTSIPHALPRRAEVDGVGFPCAACGVCSYAAQRLVSMLRMLVRKHSRAAKALAKVVTRMAELSSGAAAPTSPEEGTVLAMEHEAVQERMESHLRRIQMVVGMISDCLSARVLAHNLHLVYALLHGRQLVEDCVAFGEELMSHCSAVVKYFGTRVDTEMKEKNGVWTEDDVMQILGRSVGLTGGCCGFLPPSLPALSSSAAVASRTWRDPSGVDAATMELPAKFEYEEEGTPEEFFVPYVRTLRGVLPLVRV